MNQELGIMNQGDQGPNIDPQHIQVVRQGMREAVTHGSGRGLLALPVTSAGKTGTAQWSSTRPSHAWFTGFAPYQNPEIVVTVLIEEGGEGSAVAAPVASEIMQWWVSHRQDLDTK
jgi:penicillin-binding protein 2